MYSVSKVNDIYRGRQKKKHGFIRPNFSFDDDDTMSLGDKIPSGDYQEFWDSYEEKIMLSNAISKLKPKMKEVIELSYYEDLNQREILSKVKHFSNAGFAQIEAGT